MILFSVEDFRKQSISVTWFWWLSLLVIFFVCLSYAKDTSECYLRLPLAVRSSVSYVTGYRVMEEWIGTISAHAIQSYSCIALLCSANWSRCIGIVFARAFIGYLFMFLPYIFSKKQGLGEGDILYFALLSPLFPIATIWASFCITFISGSIFAMIVIFVQKVTFSKPLQIRRIPLIPFISLGFIVGYLL